MKNSIRHCISCILPCGALDVIRIVHSNGRVEQINGTIKARDVMMAHPKHLLKKPRSPSSVAASGDNGFPRIVIVPPEAELQRGKIYFLMPLPSPEENQLRRKKKNKKKKRKEHSNFSMMTSFVVSDRYLTDILSEKVSTTRDRRRKRVAVWRPNLESISESPSHL